jgi:DNA topoisomerase-1
MRLFIVESPAKCQKIRSYLGAGWNVIASMGHIRGLEESIDAIGIDSGWNPRFEILDGKTKAVKEIKDAAKGCNEIWLGTDDDREGEAIAWHICQILKLPVDKTPRAIFHEVTETAIKASISDINRRLDMDKVQAQLARSMLDLMVGFSISPILWSALKTMGLSAGRCQTPALHLVYDREKEIEGFASQQSWTYECKFSINGFEIDTVGTWTPTSIDEVRKYLSSAGKDGKLVDLVEKSMTLQPPTPLITSSFQQEASSQLHIGPKISMQIAQKLYEAGHITYMRTDNPVLGLDCLAECKEVIESKWSTEYVGSGAKKSKKATKAAAPVQGAHEAIHPTHMNMDSLPTEETWSDQERKVYSHIWKRTLQSQMAAAQQKSRCLSFKIDMLPTTGAEIEKEKEKLFKGSLSLLAFKGWKILNELEEDARWAQTEGLKIGSLAKWSDLTGRQIATQPPSRFSEAQLVRELEEKGIGRPSTFASLIATIHDRKYVEKRTSKGAPVDLFQLIKTGPKSPIKESKVSKDVGGDKDKTHVTALGRQVIEFLDQKFSDIFAYTFTAGMESDLDLVSTGNKDRSAILQSLWDSMKVRVTEAKSGGGGGGNAIQEFACNGYTISIANTKKGILLIKKVEGQEKPEFAAMPADKDAKTITKDEAISIFTKKAGEELGLLEDMPVILKKGPFGLYVEWNGVRCNYKEDSPIDFEELCALLKIKEAGSQDTDPSIQSFIRVVGDYTIKKGPFGLYFFRGGAAVKKNVKFPAELDPVTVGAAALAEAFNAAPAPSGGGGYGRGRGRGGGGRGRGRGGRGRGH